MQSATPQDTDMDLIARCRDGDREAFRQLVEQYERRVFNIITPLIGDPEEADDITQEVFIKVYRSLSSFRGTAQFSVWLYRITVNLCLDRLKHRRRRPEAVSLDRLLEQAEGELDVLFRDSSPDAAETLDQARLQHTVQAMLNTLTPEHRLVISLKDLEGYSQEEIAAILNCPVGTVKSRLTRAREALKERLRPFYEAWKAGGH